MKNQKKRFIRKLIKDNSAGSLLEYGLIIGFSIAIFLVIVGIVTSILDWTQGNLADFLSIFQG
jgi:Flp pilus assembly pilin Flp